VWFKLIFKKVNVCISLVMLSLMHCTLFCRRLEVQKVDRSVPTPVATKRRMDTAHGIGTKLPIVKRSRPPVTTNSDKQLQPASLPQPSGKVGLPGNCGRLTCKVDPVETCPKEVIREQFSRNLPTCWPLVKLDLTSLN
jgi:hypothetical protein